MSEKMSPMPTDPSTGGPAPPQYPESNIPMQMAAPPQAYPGYPPNGGQPPAHAPGAYQMPGAAQYGAQPPQGAPVYVVRRDHAAIEKYQQEIKENEIGCSDIFWFICCGPFALICCLPKYNRQQELRRQIDIELAKPV
ncbi:hypothetical protein DFQ27_008296 [Actinomortierella ambigua]|uniref:Uncharacterized protein n=1 Tax=Actinomortierella ambigua TaxID=1343610 RepID=A0A9P6PU43_9FUNG|nr:hypothetical protein DFQ26_001646 [Actinomortierella ambigua]KAG0252086.1 hypothetical protein DFQ27_008296 [Actinomortierella ambigua]